jgi:predicted metalloprotease
MSPTRTWKRPRTGRLIALAAAGLMLAGCANAISGQAVKVGAAAGTGSSATAAAGPSGPKTGVTPADVTVGNDGRTQSDTLAKNTIEDLYDYYGQIFQKDFGKAFTPAKALISYDSAVKDGPTVCGRSLYRSVNASYNPCADTIVWDRGQLLPDLTRQVGILAAPTVLSHEMGHLVQNRLGVKTDDVLLLEEQADCYAGGYWRWVADGNSKYFDLNQTAGIRMVLSAMMTTGDPVGTTTSAQDAHGSGFDRSYSFTLGFSNGALRCSKITSAEVKARITETGFTDPPQNFGNVAITDKFLAQIATVANSYFAQTVKGYRPPTLTPFTGKTGPVCNGAPTQFPVGYCQATNTITYNLAELARIGTPNAGFKSNNGDFSAVLILVSRYGLAAQATSGGTSVGNQSGLRGLCYAGSWASWMRTARGPDKLKLSPNDLNKAVYEVLASPIPATDANGMSSAAVIDQVQSLYIGVVFGAGQCYDFYSS